MSESRAMTLRLPVELAARLELVAMVERRAASEVIRQALAEYIERRRAEPDFQHRLSGVRAGFEDTLRALQPPEPA